ncbi:hypothetical protein HRbin08_00969 [bacterium HR08]|nr:hypothetical protein HRbin08_00969 [bacterium HR08]
MRSDFRIVNELDRLLKSTLTPDQWDARITELAKRIEREQVQVIPLLFKTLRTTKDSDLASLIIFVIERMEDPKALEHALEIVRDPSVADEVKAGLLPFLLRHNVSLSSPELVGAFKDPRSISRMLTGWLLEGLAEDEDAIAPIVADLEQWDRDSQQHWLEHFGERGDERALPLLATVAESRDVELARLAIAEIARIPSGRAIFTLENLFNHRETLWGEIERALRRLRAAGLRASPLFTAPGPVRECWLTHIDGYGNQLLLIAREGEGGRYDAALFTLSEREGIPECFSARGLTPRDYRSVVALMRRETPLVPISYEEARTLVRDALFLARRHRAFICPEFAFRRRIFGDDDLSPKEYRPEFPDFLLAEVRRQYAELLATSDRLLTVFPFSEWWMDTPTAREFVTRRKLDAPSFRLTRKLVLAFIEEVIEPERELLARRFALTAEFLLHLIGGRHALRSTYPWKATLALWKALGDRRRSLSKIPFFHELATVTIAGLAANVGCDEHPSRESHP